MSRKTAKQRATKAVDALKAEAGVTGAVTDNMQASDVGAGKEQMVTRSEAEEAIDFAQKIGTRIGVIQGIDQHKRAQAMCPVFAILQQVHAEVHKAQKKHRPMASAHEAYSVILEELDEYWDEVRADRAYQESGRVELIQTAAMCIRALIDLPPK